MTRRRLIALVFFWCAAATPAWAGPLDALSGDKDSLKAPVHIKGDTVEYFHEQQKAVGTGNVSIDYEGARLSADKITVYTSTQQALAEGHVTLVQNGSVFKGDQAEYDFNKKTGSVSRMSAEIQPSYYGKAQKIEQLPGGPYRMSNSYITTCCGDDPLYKIQSNQIDIYPQEKVIVRNAVLLVKGVPVLFLPYFEQHFLDYNHLPVQLVPGKNSDWGAFLLSKWRYNLGNSPAFKSRGNVLVDYRSKRGVAAGVENYYQGDKLGRGAFKYYATEDDAPSDEAEPSRYRVQWRHQARLTPDTTLTTEFNKLSDPNIIKDFFYREEYERDIFPDNYISLITAKPEYSLSILGRGRLDPFYTVVERSPEVRFDTYTDQLFDTPFYLRQETQFVNLKKEFRHSNFDMDATRLDWNTTLSYAGHLGAVSIVPRIGTRQTAYSRVLEGDDAQVRSTVDPGLDVSTRFYKTYDAYIDRFGLDYNQIRHIFTPTMSYNFRPDPTTLRTELQQFDAIDAIDKQNFARFSFENKLQTKEHASKKSTRLVTREIARVIPFFDMDFNRDKITNVGYDAELRPYSWLGLGSDLVYDTDDHRVDTANFDISYYRNKLRLSVGQRYVKKESVQTTLGAEWVINPLWTVSLYERYEYRLNRSREFEATVSRTFDCVILDTTYNHHEDEGDTIYFQVRLKAFPNAPFRLSQSYNSPRTSSAESGNRGL